MVNSVAAGAFPNALAATVIQGTMQSLHSLLQGIVDYAGLFPPASLDMAPAVGNYAAYRAGPEAWALGRFIVPVARLAAFELAVAPFLEDGTGAGPWQVSALLGANLDADIARVVQFNRRHTGAAVIDTVELKAARPEEIAAVAQALPGGLTPYVEIPIGADPQELIAALGRTGARAKVRTGGTTANMFPPAADLARFLQCCVAAGVPFKATAGLHHPLRSLQRLTYEPDSPSAMMYGFLNIFLATALLGAGMPMETAAELLEETSPAALHFDEDGVAWRERRLPNEALGLTRRASAIAFGSCSFREPLDDLKAMGLL